MRSVKLMTRIRQLPQSRQYSSPRQTSRVRCRSVKELKTGSARRNSCRFFAEKENCWTSEVHIQGVVYSDVPSQQSPKRVRPSLDAEKKNEKRKHDVRALETQLG